MKRLSVHGKFPTKNPAYFGFIDIYTHVYDLYSMILAHSYSVNDLCVSTHNGGVFAKKVIMGSTMVSTFVSVQEYIDILQSQEVLPSQKVILK